MKEYEKTIIINDIAHLLSRKKLVLELDQNTNVTINFNDRGVLNDKKNLKDN